MTNTTTQKAAFAKATSKAKPARPVALTTIKETILHDMADGEALAVTLLELPNLQTRFFGQGSYFVVVSTANARDDVQFQRDFLSSFAADDCFNKVVEDLKNMGYAS